MRKSATRTVLALATVLTVASPTLSSSAAELALARLTVGSAAVELQPLIDAERFTLRIAGPSGKVEEHALAAGQSATISLVDRQGGARPDGVYRWELVAMPRLDASTRAALARARETGDESVLEALRSSGQLPEPRVESGTLLVQAGRFADVEGAEPRPPGSATLANRGSDDQDVPTRDQVIPDDLIVQGSLCVGLDCVNNENFGFDTLRMKENNTRIKFEDTSTGTFPTTDWQLTANDSASGGANKFSIEDVTSSRVPFTVTGGASTNSIFVDSTGRVGFRTSTPVLDLHVATSNTPALRLEQNNSGGFTAQTWDVAGNEANFFVRDVTSGSRLPLRIRPGAPTSSVDITADGDVGIGSSTADDKLHITTNSGTNGGLLIRTSSTGTELPQLTLDNINSGQIWRFRVNNADQFVFTDATNGGKAPVVVFGNSDTNLLRIGGTDANVADSNRVTVTGELFIGSSMVTPDYVFEPDYALPSIEAQAAFMRDHKHLPAVGRGERGADGTWSVNVGNRQQGLLEELEKAHLYIVQLNYRLAELEATVAELKPAQ